MKKICFLIGFMGCGKTYWGERLAERLQLPFYDLDERIEAGAGMPILRIFETEGETAFRQIEQRYLRSVDAAAPAVVATGGGTPCFFDNMAWMNAHGTTVYLRTPPDLLAARLRLDRQARPLLQGLGEHQLEAYIANLLAQREPYYAQAQVVVAQTGQDGHLLEELLLQVDSLAS